MAVRDAQPSDVAAIAELTGMSNAAGSRLLRERTVRVHEDDEAAEVTGFVSFDASEGAVQVTHLAGASTVYPVLLEETVRFAADADLPIEMVVPIAEDVVCASLEEAGFVDRGAGPRFEGAQTRRYRRPAPGDDDAT